jgi:hypothetical protein
VENPVADPEDAAIDPLRKRTARLQRLSQLRTAVQRAR